MYNGKENARCGGGIWFGEDDQRNTAFRVPGTDQSNQFGELAAVIVALQKTQHFIPLEIISDSRYVINGLAKHLRSWEDSGWIGVKNANLFQKAAHFLKRRSAVTTFQWVKAHNGDPGNEESDRLAKEGATKTAHDLLDLSISKEFDLQGAKLASISQALAYQGIQEKKSSSLTQGEKDNLQRTKAALEGINGTQETDATIWRNTRNSVIGLRVQQFLFKSMHHAYMIGNKWNTYLNLVARANCTICGEIESMQHILLECNATARHLVWHQAKKLWPHDPQE